MKRSVERVNGVKKASVNLDTGIMSVVFQRDQTVQAAALWEAVKASGFTPVKVEMKDVVYEGPKP